MSAPLLIGMSGRKRSGKDTFAARLTGEHGFTRVAFADPMREMALALDPYVSGHFRLGELVDAYGWEFVKENFPEARRILQRLGTEGGRDVLGEDLWVNVAMRLVAALRNNGTPVVVTDVRFPNEARAIEEAGGYLLRVERPGLPEGDLHASETALDDWAEFDGVVSNSRDIDDLRHQADSMLRYLRWIDAGDVAA